MIWNVLIDRKGVNRIQTELLLRKAQSGDTGRKFVVYLRSSLTNHCAKTREKVYICKKYLFKSINY